MLPRRSRHQTVIEPLESRQLLTVIPGFSETQLASGMTRPVQMAFAPDGRLFITQQDGKLRVFKNGQLLSTPFVTVNAHNTGERGLLGVTFDPNFASNNFVYVYYTHPDGNGNYRNRVSRFTADGDVAAAGSERVLIETDNLGSGTWHNAGALEFGADGKLYVGVGENQQNQVAQSMTSLLGKVLRINADGSIPSDNPFYNQNSGKYRAIWALGFRNPFTMDSQPGTGRIFVNDVGAARVEEIDELKRGANYGWPGAEGPSSNPAFTNPFYSYNHAGGDDDDSAITGAAWYNPANATFPADYAGDFFFGEYGLGTIKRIDVNTKAVSNFVSNRVEITDVETGPDGAVYYLQRTGGRLFRVQSTTTSAPSIVAHPESQTVALGQPVTFTVSANGANLDYQWQRNGSDIPGATGASFTIDATSASDHGDQFRVVVSNPAGDVTSNAATLTVLAGNPPDANINGPLPMWVGGGAVSFSGTGTDAQDGTLPASAFTWRVDLHHDTHSHPFIAPYGGVTSDTFDIPDVGHDAEHSIWYRIHLTVRDSAGLEDATFVDVFPKKVNLSLATEPAGLSLNLDGAPLATPYASPAIVGFRRSLGAPATQTVNGVTYAFDGWSDGGAATHDVLIPDANTVYTARYRVTTAPPPPETIALRASADAHVRDGSYAGQNFGAATEMQVKNDGPSRVRYTYLTFDLSGVGADVTSAVLKFRGRLDNTLAPSVTTSVFAAPSTWNESTITWNNQPAPGATALGAFTVTGTTARDYEVDLTSYFAAQKAAGATSASVVLHASSDKATVLLASDEAASNKPQLVIQSGGENPGPGPGPGPSPSALRVTADAHVRDGSFANQNFGSSTELQLKKNSTGSNREIYLKFDLSTLEGVGSAKLRVFGRIDSSTQRPTVGVFAATDTGWGESDLTWDNRPPAGTTALATTTVATGTRKWYEWDVTAYLQAQKSAGAQFVTLVLRSLTTTTPHMIFSSDEAATNRPELFVTP